MSQRLRFLAITCLLGAAAWCLLARRPGVGDPSPRSAPSAPAPAALPKVAARTLALPGLGLAGTNTASDAVDLPAPAPGPVEEPPPALRPAALEQPPEPPDSPQAPAPGSPDPGAAGDEADDPEKAPALPPVTQLENLRGGFRQYAARFGGNPVGDNAEITAALRGGNPRRTVFLGREDGLRVNREGETIDAWGTPIFFHQLSRSEMEIRSAGPDRQMWTSDDLVSR